MEQKYEEIYKHLESLNMSFHKNMINIDNEESLKIIHDLFINNVILDTEFTDSVIYCYFAMYYHIKKKLRKAILNYKKAIKLGNTDAMVHLGSLYYHDKYYMPKALNMYLEAFEKGNRNAVNYIEEFYRPGNYEEMAKYALIGVSQGNTKSMLCYGDYSIWLRNYDEASKYYLMAFENNNLDSLLRLGKMYWGQDNHEMAIKYFLIGANMFVKDCIDNINLIISSDHLKINEYTKFALDCYDHLNEENLNKLNGIISLKNSDYSKALATIDCVICKNICECVFMKCGHSICAKCFFENKCNICQ